MAAERSCCCSTSLRGWQRRRAAGRAVAPREADVTRASCARHPLRRPATARLDLSRVYSSRGRGTCHRRWPTATSPPPNHPQLRYSAVVLLLLNGVYKGVVERGWRSAHDDGKERWRLQVTDETALPPPPVLYITHPFH